MAKTNQFKAYDLRSRKKLHTIASPPVRITQSRLQRGEWTSQAASTTTKVTKKRGRSSKNSKPPRRPSGLLRCTNNAEISCLHCGRTGDDPNCGPHCYRAFKNQHFLPHNIDIRGPGPLGYGAFTKPGVRIAKGEYLDEYIGDLRPLPSTTPSRYSFVIPDTCVVDAERAGNWTRFINSSCRRPNVKPWADFLGKRRVIVFQALREIGPGEEVLFDYGARWFEKAGFACACEGHGGVDGKG